MFIVLAGALLVVASCGAVRAFAPARHPHAGAAPLDVEVWHGVLGASMAAMLLVSFPVVWARLVAVVCLLAMLWCVGRAISARARAVYLRSAACAAAMVAMLIPASLTSGAGDGMAAMPGMPGMSGMRMTGTHPAALPHWLTASLLVVMVGIVLAGVLRLGGVAGTRSPGAPRIQAVGEMLMAGAMAWMLVPLV